MLKIYNPSTTFCVLTIRSIFFLSYRIWKIKKVESHKKYNYYAPVALKGAKKRPHYIAP